METLVEIKMLLEDHIQKRQDSCREYIEKFYLNTIEQLFIFVEQLDQLEVCLPFSKLLAGISILAVFQNLRWNSNKTSLILVALDF